MVITTMKMTIMLIRLFILYLAVRMKNRAASQTECGGDDTYNDDDDGLEGQSSQRRVPPQLTIGLTLLEGCLAFISVMNDHHHDNYNHDNDNQDMQII